jgi:hypothetical protein
VKFDIVGAIENAETIATGSGVEIRPFLRKAYGRGRWRKRKGTASVRLPNGTTRRVELHWYEAHGLKQSSKKFAVCLDNADNEASLILGKVYRVLPDSRAAKDDLIRVVDDSGEDYLFHKDQFALVEFPASVRKKILALQDAS